MTLRSKDFENFVGKAIFSVVLPKKNFRFVSRFICCLGFQFVPVKSFVNWKSFN